LTFIPGSRLDACAAELWRSHHLQPGFDVDDLADRLGLSMLWEVVPDHDESIVLGLLDPSARRIVLNERHLEALEANGGRLSRFTVGHEIGHWLLHAEGALSGTLSLLEGGRVWCRSGSREPAERQADMFAGRLLIPKDHLLAALPKDPWSGWPPVYRLADIFLVSVTAMMVRLEELRWAHRDEFEIPTAGPRSIPGQDQLPLD
jgi:hypothetical protein